VLFRWSATFLRREPLPPFLSLQKEASYCFLVALGGWDVSLGIPFFLLTRGVYSPASFTPPRGADSRIGISRVWARPPKITSFPSLVEHYRAESELRLPLPSGPTLVKPLFFLFSPLAERGTSPSRKDGRSLSFSLGGLSLPLSSNFRFPDSGSNLLPSSFST